MRSKFLSVVSVSVALCAPYSAAAQPVPLRQPVGVYARPDIDGCVAHPNQGSNTSTDECLSNQITALLSDPAISGVSAFVNWNDISLTIPTNSLVGTNDWSILDDIFGAVAQWNADNPTNIPKTIQLGLQPGFHTPQWVFNNLSSCDAMFLTNSQGTIVNSQGTLVGVDPSKVTNTCGCASFLEAEDKANPTVLPLPLPWNSFYTNAWATFIRAVAGKYGTNSLLVSMAVAGPTASSCEMILPNENDDPTNYLKWNPLFALEFPSDPSLANSDTLFIQEWEDAIDVYGEAFSNLTLVVTTGTGLPNFLDTNGVPYPTYTVPPGFAPDCADTNLARIMDCAAETTILAYFADPRHGGKNAKATQESGLGAVALHIHPLGGGDLDAHGIKWLAQSTPSGSAPLPGTSNVVSRVLGGLQFDYSFSMSPQTEGCPQLGGCPTNDPISPEQAFYNVLRAFFDGTQVGGSYGVTTSNLPLNYVQIYAADVLYAETNSEGSLVVDGSGLTNNITAQDEFNNLSLQILEIAQVPLNVQAVGDNLQLSWPLSAAPLQLQVNSDLSKPGLWMQVPESPALIGASYEVLITPSNSAAFYRLAPP
ncbi:MAG TPA: hypothetical protein VGR14_05860 [Verrucomicrobiae bacterium]|nr:hypothetical protein [Verrucomicrobiae bacterium]